jgi:hypothetical protein
MVSAAVMDLGSVSSFRSGEQTHSSSGLYIDLHEGLEILRGEGRWHRFEGIIGSSRAIREVLDQVLTVAPAEVHGPHRRGNRHRKGTCRACHPHAGRAPGLPVCKVKLRCNSGEAARKRTCLGTTRVHSPKLLRRDWADLRPRMAATLFLDEVLPPGTVISVLRGTSIVGCRLNGTRSIMKPGKRRFPSQEPSNDQK